MALNSLISPVKMAQSKALTASETVYAYQQTWYVSCALDAGSGVTLTLPPVGSVKGLAFGFTRNGASSQTNDDIIIADAEGAFTITLDSDQEATLLTSDGFAWHETSAAKASTRAT